MRRALVAWLLLPACGFESHQAGEDAGTHQGDDAEAVCFDPDGDEFGDGNACRGGDCREDDPTLHECECDPQGVGTGCLCGPDAQPVACYDGPAGTAGVGTCLAGLRRCDDGRWTDCLGQVVPVSPEVDCNYEDDDCDGVADDGVLSECGNCNSDCSVLRYGVGGEPFPTDGDDAPLVRDDGSISIGDGADLRAVVTIRPPGFEDWWCGDWGPLDLSARVPEGASLLVEVRGGWSAEDLEVAPWDRVLRLPEDATPMPLPDSASDQMVIELRITLLADDPDRLPVLDWVTVQVTDPGCGFQ